MPKICSLKGTSNLTLQISADDLNAKIRCFEESQADVPEMFIETGSFDVQFPVKLVNINKQPNKKQYDRLMSNITLTCKGSGNPELTYVWFKKDNKKKILSRKNLYVIDDVIRNNSGLYICEAYNIIGNVEYRTNYSVEIDIVHATYAIPITCALVIVVTCFAARKRNCKREKRSIHSEVSDDQDDISDNNDYEEIGSVYYHEVNLSNDRIDTSTLPITEGEIDFGNRPISSCSSSSGINITMSHFYVNTNIFNTNEHIERSAINETVSNPPNEFGNGIIGIDNTFINDNSESDTHQVHQYENMTSPRVQNVYEDLNRTTAGTHKYENLITEGKATFTQ
ncbi:unnamed protein product [Mytilus coruscus]|uniref:Ig-like domain-containing protein n=1 Tax=Mytilus coruscus TaxID=42192 RepID=A0A6J8BQP0_MYTCO|nr:unnamed protein product [Mytilus coruscus]